MEEAAGVWDASMKTNVMGQEKVLYIHFGTKRKNRKKDIFTVICRE